MLEPCDGKLSRTVLRGLGAGNSPRLPDRKSMWKKTYKELLDLNWPSQYVVKYNDGKSETFVKWQGVFLEDPSDDEEGIGGMFATFPNQDPSNKTPDARYIRFNEINTITNVNGNILWQSKKLV
jgi:hypothetical protein